MSLAIIGVGASAGGLKEFERLLKNLPEQLSAALVLLRHFSAEQDSFICSILQRYTERPVRWMEEGMLVEERNVYVLPPKQKAVLQGQKLHLSPLAEQEGPRQVIDVFFKSLAEEQGAEAMGVILSGMGKDGTAGSEAIRTAGGLVLVQAPDTTVYDAMPRSILEAELAQLSMPVSAMPKTLANYLTHDFKLPDLVENTIGRAEEETARILHLLREETGQDFSDYKKNTIQRRIHRRMVACHCLQVEDYYQLLRQDTTELHALQRELLVQVTSFFRDPEVFGYAYKELLPQLVKSQEPIRVWVPGCATGEEAYSWAMLFQEYFQEHGMERSLRLFATDMDEQSIAKARRGVYSTDIDMNVSAERLKRFFDLTPAGYRVKKHLRAQLIFAVQNLVQDPPYSQIDLVSCRNLLIYFDKKLQERSNYIFQYALEGKGFLMLGKAERPLEELFEQVKSPFNIYKCKAKRPTKRRFWTPSSSSKGMGLTLPKDWGQKSQYGLKERMQDVLLERKTPPSLLINSEREVLYVQGNMGPYLELTTGQMSRHLIQIARKELKWVLSNTLRRALQTGKEARHEAILLPVTYQGQHYVDISIFPLEEEGDETYWLVCFEAHASKDKAPDLAIKTGSLSIHELEKELAFKEQSLQRSIEKLASTNQDLKSANEEAQSANEELQSTNEELETSKEELQSVNEELITTNHALNEKVKELNQLSNTLNNLLSSTNIATLFLDRSLQVFRFTPAASAIVELLESDIGRPVQQLKHRLLDNHWLELAEEVLKDLQSRELEVQSQAQQYFWLRIQPYQTLEGKVEGLVLTFSDITEKKKQEIELKRHQEELEKLVAEKSQELKEREQRFKRISEVSSDYAFGYRWESPTRRKQLWSYGDFKAITGYDQDTDVMAQLLALMQSEDAQQLRAKEQLVYAGDSCNMEYAIRPADQSVKWLLLKLVPEWDAQKQNVESVLCTLKDVSERKINSQRIENNERLLKRTEHIAHVGSWQLQAPPFAVTHLSDEAFRILGIPIQTPAPTLEKVVPNILSHNLEQAMDILQESITQKEGFFVEIDVQHPQKGLRHCQVRGHAKLNEEGEVEYFYGSIQDITERIWMQKQLERSEAKFRNIADNVPGLVLKYRLYPDGRDEVLYISKGVEELHEIPQEEASDNAPLLWSYIHEEDLTGFQKAVQQSAETLQPISYEFRLALPDGRIKWVKMRSIPTGEADGSVVWDTLMVEITQQKEALQQLEEREASLQKINATKNKLFAIIGHDLKGPLNNIIGLAELMEMNAPEEPENEEEIWQLSRHMYQSAKSLARLLDNLLTWSRSQMNKIYYQPKNIRLRAAVDNCIDLIRPQANKKQLEIVNEILEKDEVFADEDMIVVVIRNLLSNALKFTFPKGKIRLYSQPSGKDTLVIAIKDSGVGIAPHLVEQIMSSEVQITTNGTSGEKGTGLGLNICKDFIAKNKGRFWLESEQGEGSTFYFSLPRPKAAKN